MTLKQRQFLVFSAVLAGCKWKFSRHHVKDIVPMSGVQRNFNFRYARSIIVSLTTSALNFFFPCHFTTFHPISTVHFISRLVDATSHLSHTSDSALF
jgi:hypothetical protein